MAASTVPEVLCRRFKNEAVAVYQIMGLDEHQVPVDNSPLRRYVVSTSGTRKLMNFPEIVSRNFAEEMEKGLSSAFIGIDRIETLSTIPSRQVNVFTILRGGLNFRLGRVLRNSFGYKWQSASFVSSQRVRVGETFDVEEDAYRKFVVPEDPTIYSGDIVATGVSLDSALGYLYRYLVQHAIQLENFVFVGLGCREAEPVLERWHARFKDAFRKYDRTLVVYLEGRFGLADESTPLRVRHPNTDLLRSYELGSLHTPEFEYSQFERVIIPLEGCTIYDGGKKSFEPIHHLEEVREFWKEQYRLACSEDLTLWDEYCRRFPLAHYFKDPEMLELGSPELLAERRSGMWRGLGMGDYAHIFQRFRWLWTDERLASARKPGSFRTICEKKLQDLDLYLD